MRTIIDHGTIVNEGKTFRGSLVLDNDHIESVIVGETAPRGSYDHHVDATGCLVLLASLTSTSISASPDSPTRRTSRANRAQQHGAA